MPGYVPNNVQIYSAAFAGAMAGMAINASSVTDPISGDYALVSAIAGAWAQSFDTVWGSRATTLLDVQGAQSASQTFWISRSPSPQQRATFSTPNTWRVSVTSIIAFLTQGETYFAGQGIVPPPIPSGGGGGFSLANGILSHASFVDLDPGSVPSGQLYYANVTIAGGGQFFTLHPLSSYPDGWYVMIKDVNGLASVGRPIQIQPNGTDLIEVPGSPGTYANANANFTTAGHTIVLWVNLNAGASTASPPLANYLYW